MPPFGDSRIMYITAKSGNPICNVLRDLLPSVVRPFRNCGESTGAKSCAVGELDCVIGCSALDVL